MVVLGLLDTCSWNVCGVIRTESADGTLRADARSRPAEQSGLFRAFTMVAPRRAVVAREK